MTMAATSYHEWKTSGKKQPYDYTLLSADKRSTQIYTYNIIIVYTYYNQLGVRNVSRKQKKKSTEDEKKEKKCKQGVLHSSYKNIIIIPPVGPPVRRRRPRASGNGLRPTRFASIREIMT